MEEALELANDTKYGLGAGAGAATVIWPIRWGAAFRPGAVDQLLSRLPGTCGVWWLQTIGIGRETHKMMLEHYQQTKCRW